MGYYTNNEYQEEQLRAEPPSMVSTRFSQKRFRVGHPHKHFPAELTHTSPFQTLPGLQPALDKLLRNILADKPRVTKFPIEWDSAGTQPQETSGLASGMEVDS